MMYGEVSVLKNPIVIVERTIFQQYFNISTSVSYKTRGKKEKEMSCNLPQEKRFLKRLIKCIQYTIHLEAVNMLNANLR